MTEKKDINKNDEAFYDNYEFYDDYDDASDISDLIRESELKEYNKKLNKIFDNINNVPENNNKKLKTKKFNFDVLMPLEEEGQSLDELQETLKTQKEVRTTFVNNAKTDRKLKITYGIVLIFMLLAQLITVNVIFVLGGLGILSYSDATFNIFIGGALIEVIVVIKIAVEYLFTDNISKTVNKMIDNHRDGSHKF